MIHIEDTYEYLQTKRTVVIGDVHGDIKRFKRILIDAGVINSDLEWTADPPDTIVVQIGDQIDSMNRVPGTEEWEMLHDINMLYLTHSLNNIAKTKGGRVISMVGNHELMNVMGNFSYVSQNSLLPYRRKLFEPQGTLSHILAEMKICVKIGNLFFCHAGIRKNHLDLLAEKGKDVSCLNTIWKNLMLNSKVANENAEIFYKIINNDNGILWTRTADTHEDLGDVMKRLGCVYMFVGHTPAETIQLIQSKIWYIDSCISRAFGSKSYQYIDIVDKSINIRTITDT